MSLTPERYAELRDLFAEADALPPAAREAFLAEVRGRDAGLGRELAALLADSADTEALRAPIRRELDASGLPEERAAEAEVAGFEIVGVLGRGGMGTVYRARQRGELDREVALKMIGDRFPDADLLARFERERRLTASLSHPAIAQVFVAGVTDDGRPFMALELVDGPDLVTSCDERKLTLERRLELLARVCDGVQHAHDRGLLHRDLKPTNILVDRQGFPKIIDFGIAKPILGGGTTQGPIGSPSWMSPEQLEGAPDLDVRTDVYALGVILYELLAGELPYRFDRNLARSFAEVSEGRAEPPSRRLAGTAQPELERRAASRGVAAARLPARVSPDLDAIVLKAMAADRERRYRSVLALAEDLRAYLEGRPVSARPATPAYRLSRWVSRHRALSAVSVLALLAAVLGTAATVVSARRAAARAEEARLAAEESREVADLLLSLFRGARPGRASEAELSARELLGRGADRLRSELAERPGIKARLLLEIGTAYRLLGDRTSAEACFREALAARRSVAAPSGAADVVVGDLVNNLAILDMDAQRWDAARKGFAEAEAVFARILPPEDARHADIAANLGLLAGRTGKLEEAEKHLLDALARRRASSGPRSQPVASTELNLASLYGRMERWEDALVRSRSSLGTRKALLGPDHVDVAGSLVNVAVSLKKLKRWEEAEVSYREALAIYERALGERSDRTGIAAMNLALLLQERGCADEAQPLFERAAFSLAAGLGGAHPSVAQAHLEAAATASDRKDPAALARACRGAEDALAISRGGTDDAAKELARLCGGSAAER